MKRPLLLAALAVAASALADNRAQPSPRVRAAWGMLLYLHNYATKLVELDAEKHQFTKDGCPTGIGWVTFGMAKTDPWGSPFLMRCTQIGSAGPDRRAGTADDLWSDRPIVEAAAACRTACARVKACKGGPGAVERWCGAACLGSPPEVAFYGDTCALFAGCPTVLGCLEAAASGRAPEASCADFGQAAARVLKQPRLATPFTAECEQDVIRAHELVCVQASSSASQLSTCFLTVNRDHVEAIAAGGK